MLGAMGRMTRKANALLQARVSRNVNEAAESKLSLLDRMRTGSLQQMPVISGGSVIGIVTRDSILRVLQTRGGFGAVPGR